ncbi:hypothetical protein BDZ89DRAFT_897706, partial [Hymenopellis radicata]
KEGEAYLKELNVLRDSARRAMAKAQDAQRRYYNKGRKAFPDLPVGSKVLVNPHSLEWVESRGKGAKLTQRGIGPFEVQEKINPKVYRLRM